MQNPNKRFRALSALVSTALVVFRADAAVIHVNAAAAPGGNGQSWAAAFNDLRAALSAAQNGDAVWIARGTYYPTTGTDRTLNFNIPSGVKVYGGFAGTEASIHERTADPDPTSADPAFDTILSGEIGEPGFHDNTFNLVNLQSTNAATVLDRVVVTRGVPGTTFPFNAGGGVRINSGSPTISNCLIIDNEGSQGAGLWLESTNAAVVDRCIIRDNRSQVAGGTGAGVLQRFGTATYTDCTFLDNLSGGSGAALHLTFSAGATIRNSRFEGNRSGNSGGAVWTSLNCTTLVEDTIFEGNSAPRAPVGASGGAVYNNGGTHTYRRCIFTGNASQSAGAAADQNGAVTVYEHCRFISNVSDVTGGAAWTTASTRYSDCLFQGNESGTGGGLSASTAATVERCTFHGNFTHAPTNYGGALYLTGGGSSFTDCDFTSNTANTAGVAHIVGANQTFDRCRFIGNSTNASGGVLWHAGGTATYTNCLIAGNTASFGFGSVLFMQSGAAATFINCTIVGNGNLGVALYNNNLPLTLSNCIVRNVGSEVHSPATVTAAYSNIEGGLAGTGNIDAAPVFVDAVVGDYSLASGSPGIDAGSNALVPLGVTVDLASNPRFVDDPGAADTGVGPAPIVDMGAYERQVAPPTLCPGDANRDGIVNFADVTSVLSNFGFSGAPGIPGDANGDGAVTFADITNVLSNFGFICP